MLCFIKQLSLTGTLRNWQKFSIICTLSMEDSTQKQKAPNLYLLFAAVVVIILLVIGYFTFFRSSPISQAFFSKYQQQDMIVKQTLPKIQYDYTGISQQIQAQNASEAARLVKDNLVQSLQNKKSSEDIIKKTGELKVLLTTVTDAALKEKILTLFTQLDERNKRMKTVIETQTNVFTVLRNHFGALSVGQKNQSMPQNIDSVIQATSEEVRAIVQLQTSIDVAFEDIVKLAGIDPNTFTTADAIKMSLSATPEQKPTITDFPTPTITPTLAVTPTGSPSATPQASPSAQ